MIQLSFTVVVFAGIGVVCAGDAPVAVVSADCISADCISADCISASSVSADSSNAVSSSTTDAKASDQANADPTPEQKQQLHKMLSNTTLVGRFTLDDKMDQIPKAERYEIQDVNQAVGNLWTLMVRIKYGKVDTTLPLTVPIVWADGTPMVSLKNVTIPGMGSGFSAHVIFEGNRYAGTWQHNDKGGHLFGTIAKTPKAKPEL